MRIKDKILCKIGKFNEENILISSLLITVLLVIISSFKVNFNIVVLVYIGILIICKKSHEAYKSIKKFKKQ